MKTVIGVLATIVLVLGLAFSSGATTINDPWNTSSNSDEMNLFEIVNGWLGTIYSSSQAILNDPNVLKLATLSAGGYTISDYASFAGWTETFGYYTPAGTTGGKSQLLFADADGIFSLASVLNFNAGAQFGFYDTPSGAGTKYTEFALNPGFPGTGQTNGLILGINDIAGQLHYIVAFEDQSLGDVDYNDIVVDVAPVPVPATVLLLGSGLFGLLGWRRKTV